MMVGPWWDWYPSRKRHEGMIPLRHSRKVPSTAEPSRVGTLTSDFQPPEP